jgi:hypothetical protein
LDRQESAERAAVIDYAGAAAKHLAEPDGPFPTSLPRDFGGELEQIIPQLGGTDEQTRAAAMEVLTSLPGEAYRSIRAAAEKGKTPKAAQPALQGVLMVFSRRSAREEQLHNQRVRMLRELLNAFEHFGRHDAKWDARARGALTAFFQSGPAPFRTAAQETWIVNAMEKVVADARCDDPAVLFAYGCMIDELQSHRLNSGNDSAGVFQQAAAIAEQDHWPAKWQALFNARVLAARTQLEFKMLDQPGAKLNIDAASGFLASDWLPPRTKLDWARRILANQLSSRRIIGAMSSAGGPLPKVDPLADYQKLHDEMEKQFPGGIEPLILAGEFYTDYAWDARGGDYAYTVTEQGRKLLHERLVVAKESLEKAYALDPSDAIAPGDMIVVCMGLNEDPMIARQWLDRAMAADPDDHEAVENMLEELEPKWHGNSEDLLQFARACRATHNYRSRMSLAIAEAHERLAVYAQAPGKYLGKPEICDEIRAAYESYLALFPDDRQQRTRYAYDAARAEKWTDARAQFAILGDDPWLNVFIGESYETLRTQTTKALSQSQ